jgi:hypothetical protein
MDGADLKADSSHVIAIGTERVDITVAQLAPIDN